MFWFRKGRFDCYWKMAPFSRLNSSEAPGNCDVPPSLQQWLDSVSQTAHSVTIRQEGQLLERGMGVAKSIREEENL
jgi:hypothetical protein